MSPIDFQRAVLERSRSVPVVVDFWAPWCAPCRVLGPIIEELAAASGGRWELVKIDTDEQPEVAARMGIQGIPTVKLFRDGIEAAEFVGALPREEIRLWLDRHLPDPGAERLAGIVARWESEGPAIAADLEALLAGQPDAVEARLRLAQAVVGRDPARAREVLRAAETPIELGELEQTVTSLAELAGLGDDLPEHVAGQLRAARDRFAAHDLDGTLENLIDAATADRAFGDELARRAAVALFHLLGQDHELTRKHRRRLAMALHA